MTLSKGDGILGPLRGVCEVRGEYVGGLVSVFCVPFLGGVNSGREKVRGWFQSRVGSPFSG